MQAGIKDVELLKVAHHGSAIDTNSMDFIERMSPEYAVISCGENNVYGHPHGETLMRYECEQCKIYRTDELGAITIAVRNKKVIIE
jgi:competence protein ComEC